MPLSPFRRVWTLPEGIEFKTPKKISRDLAMDVLEQVKQKYSIDESRIYLAGTSVGGFGVFGTLIEYPDVFAGGLVASGGWVTRDADDIPPVPLWIFHSADDPQIPVIYARRMVEALEKRGIPVKYTEFSGVGHASWNPAYGKPVLASSVILHQHTAGLNT